jgi:hypothetical protein
MKRCLYLLILLSITVSGGARAGGLEPFLAKWVDNLGAKAQLPLTMSPILAWDASEAARGRARVFVLRTPGVPWQDLRERMREADPASSWEGTTGDFAQVVVDATALDRITSIPGVSYVSRPPRAVPLVESEGLDSMRVPPFQQEGWSGDEVRIAVLDLGFDGYDRLLDTELGGQIRVKSFFRSPAGNGDINGVPPEVHGTACAEIVREIAPGAVLYLVNVESPADLQAAVDWLIGEKVSVITHSIGWYWGGLNGTGPIDDIVDSATRHGILWVNASGNEALRHTWTHGIDADGNGLVEFDNDGGAEKLDFSWDTTHNDLVLALLWDSWPTSPDLDFTIEVVDGTNQVLATSSALIPGYAAQYIDWEHPLDSPPTGVRIRVAHGSGAGHILHLFRIGQGHYMYPCGLACPGKEAPEDRSLLAPADDRSVLTAGATDWRTGLIDNYTSHDTEAGKPEIYGPVGISTFTYGGLNFRGTSAAAPHIAGAAALLASARIRGGIYDLLWSREDIDFLLKTAAAPLPGEGAPSAWGIVRMPITPPALAASSGPRILGNPAWGAVRWVAGCDRVEVSDVSGRVIAHPRGDWDGLDDRGATVPPGIYWLRCPGGDASRVVWLGRTAAARRR